MAVDLLDLLMLVVGGVFLYFGAEWLVGGASGLARIAGVRPLVVGLTVVAWGTSAPELVVSVLAALEGSPAIAVGNVVGSNIANLGLILGITALIALPRVDGRLIRLEIPVMVGSAILVPLFLLNDRISRLEGALLLVLAIVFSVWVVNAGRTSSDPEPDLADAAPKQAETAPSAGAWKLSGLTLVGLGVLIAGGRFFVLGATGVATAFGISERVVGLTVVAVGTSLPELATSLVAAFRGHADIAVGNVVGSNIFNVLLVLGAASVIYPMEQSLQVVRTDLAVMVAMTLVGAVTMRSARHLTRIEGGVLTVGYAAFIGWLVVGG